MQATHTDREHGLSTGKLGSLGGRCEVLATNLEEHKDDVQDDEDWLSAESYTIGVGRRTREHRPGTHR